MVIRALASRRRADGLTFLLSTTVTLSVLDPKCSAFLSHSFGALPIVPSAGSEGAWGVDNMCYSWRRIHNCGMSRGLRRMQGLPRSAGMQGSRSKESGTQVRMRGEAFRLEGMRAKQGYHSCGLGSAGLGNGGGRQKGYERGNSLKAMALDGDGDEVELLRLALDQMQERGVLAGQLLPHELRQLRSFAEIASSGPSPISCSTLDLGTSLEGRWRLAIPPEQSWLVFLPGADVILDVNREGSMQYSLEFRSRWLMLQAIHFCAKFQLLQGGSRVAYKVAAILLQVAGMAIKVPFIQPQEAEGQVSTAYFDGDIWMDRSFDGLTVFRYIGPSKIQPGFGIPQQKWYKQPVGQLLARSFGAFWRVGALIALTALHLAVVGPFLLLGLFASTLVWAVNLLRGDLSEKQGRPPVSGDRRASSRIGSNGLGYGV